MEILCFVLDGGGVSSAVEGSRNGVPSTVHSGTRLQQNTVIFLLTKQPARSINISSLPIVALQQNFVNVLLSSLTCFLRR